MNHLVWFSRSMTESLGNIGFIVGSLRIDLDRLWFEIFEIYILKFSNYLPNWCFEGGEGGSSKIQKLASFWTITPIPFHSSFVGVGAALRCTFIFFFFIQLRIFGVNSILMPIKTNFHCQLYLFSGIYIVEYLLLGVNFIFDHIRTIRHSSSEGCSRMSSKFQL